MPDLEAHSTFTYRSLGYNVLDRKTFVTLDADGCTLPSDWYLSLAGAATSAAHSGMQPSPNLPLPLP